MKRILSALLVFAALFTLSSCGKGGEAEYVQSNGGAFFGSPIMKGDGGYYYNASTLSELALRYYDIETGKTIYLCSKPECAHDGNIFCTATSEKYYVLGTAYYENELYISAIEKTDGERLYKLLRAAKDGTELTEISTFAKIPDDEAPLVITASTDLVIHKGKAYCSYEFFANESEAVEGIAEIDISTGRSRSIIEGTEYGTLLNLTAAGDKIWFMSFSLSTIRIYAYNIDEKRIERTVDLKDGYPEGCAAVNGKLWYTLRINSEKNLIKIYDPITNETADFAFEDFVPVSITTDGKYLFIADSDSEYVTEKNVRVAVCSLEGKKLTEFEIPMGASSQGNYTSYTLNVLDDTVYIQYYDKVVCCFLENILAGKCAWENLFFFEGRE